MQMANVTRVGKFQRGGGGGGNGTANFIGGAEGKNLETAYKQTGSRIKHPIRGSVWLALKSI